MLLAPCSAKLSAQSPPCNRKDSPAATRASAFFRLRASPANTSGGNVASWASTSANALASGNSGTCITGLLRQLSGVHRSDMGSLQRRPQAHCKTGRNDRVIHRRRWPCQLEFVPEVKTLRLRLILLLIGWVQRIGSLP